MCYSISKQRLRLFFLELYDQFIINGIKSIPSDIYNLLTPIALAHWICGDGYSRNGGVALATDSYSMVEVVRLINVLIVRYNLECSLFTPLRVFLEFLLKGIV